VGLREDLTAWTLTRDLSFQSAASYGHAPLYAKIKVKGQLFKRQNGNEQSDTTDFITFLSNTIQYNTKFVKRHVAVASETRLVGNEPVVC